VELSGAEIVFHLASVFLASHKPTDVSRLIEGNIEFATQLVDAMIAHNVSKLINTGTSWQYYQSEEYNPVNLYAATKQAFESILQYYIEACGLSVATLLLYDTYGPRDPRAKLISVLWECALSQRPLRMSPGAQLIDLVYIDDVLDAFVRVVDVVDLHECGHRHFSVSSGNPVSLRKIVAIFEEVSGLPISVDWGERPYRFREVMCPYVGYKPVPGWKAKVALREGLPLSNPELVPED
jgi:nucleoside-diphosphate-sugar epimerase